MWELADLFPRQGDWSERDYLGLRSDRRIEFIDGCLEFLPMPTRMHERIVRFLFRLLDAFALRSNLGEAYFNGYRMRTIASAFRVPDVLFVFWNRKQERDFSTGADIAFEVVSEGHENRERDLAEKRAEYAAAGIPEYWIVDPETTTITVLTLDGAEYRVHGEFQPGDNATSVLLPGFEVNVAECFAAAE